MTLLSHPTPPHPRLPDVDLCDGNESVGTNLNKRLQMWNGHYAQQIIRYTSTKYKLHLVPTMAGKGNAFGARNGTYAFGARNWTLSGPEKGQFSGPETGTLSGPEKGTLLGPEKGKLSGPETGTLSGPEKGTLLGPEKGKLSGYGEVQKLQQTEVRDATGMYQSFAY